MHVEWYGQSAFRLSTPDTTVAITRSGTCRDWPARAACVERLPESSFDTGSLPATPGPLVVVPAAP